MDSRSSDEAALWVARLQRGDWTSADERMFRAWLNAEADNRHAFDLATTAWNLIGGAQRLEPAVQEPVRRRAVLAGGILSALLVVGGSTSSMAFARSFTTGVGEQKDLTLPDGTRAKLDVCSAIDVRLSSGTREIRVAGGHVFLEFGENDRLPLTVMANGCAVTSPAGALNIARLSKLNANVTVLKGVAQVARSEDGSGNPVLLTPGRRLVEENRKMILDRPDVAQITSWQSGYVTFDDERLGDVALRMNEYGPMRLIIDPGAADLRVSGRFEGRDAASFVDSIELVLPVKGHREGSNFVIARANG